LNLDVKQLDDILAQTKTENKREVLENRLPPTRLVDVSSYFGKKAGTLLFLGVDTDYHDEQIVRNETADVIDKLCQTAGKYGYSNCF